MTSKLVSLITGTLALTVFSFTLPDAIRVAFADVDCVRETCVDDTPEVAPCPTPIQCNAGFCLKRTETIGNNTYSYCSCSAITAAPDEAICQAYVIGIPGEIMVRHCTDGTECLQGCNWQGGVPAGSCKRCVCQ